jgi:hypothetical protein
MQKPKSLMKKLLVALFHASFAFGSIGLFFAGFGRGTEETALYWLAALGLLSIGQLVGKQSEKS